MKALIFVVIMLVLYGGSLVLKNQEIEKNKGQYIPTTYDLQKKQGIPVYAEKVAKGKFQKFITISGAIKDGSLASSVSPAVKSKIKVGEAARLEVDNGDKVYIGQVTGISRGPSLLTGLYEVYVKFKQPLPKKIKAVTVDIPVNEVPNVLLVSREAVSNREAKPVAFVIKDNKLEKRTVEIAGSNADVYWVKSGLNHDDTVVTSDSRYFAGGEFVQVVNETRKEL